MRKAFFLLSGLLICLISSCTKENVSSFDDKFLKRWNVESTIYQRIGVDTVFETSWETTDSTYITYEFRRVSDIHQYTIIIFDEDLNVIPGKPDTLYGMWEKLDNDFVIVGDQSFKINYLTNSGTELESSRPFSEDITFHTEKQTVYLTPFKGITTSEEEETE